MFRINFISLVLLVFSLSVISQDKNHSDKSKAEESASEETETITESSKVYKYTDKNGVVHFTDKPVEGAEEVVIKPLPQLNDKPVSMPKVLVPNNSKRKANEPDYENLHFVQPTNDGVIRNNAGTITLTASVTPTLKKGHSLRFFVDGKPLNADGMSASLQGASYGEHQASFVIVDAKGKQIQSSETIQFTLLNQININKRK